MATATLASRVAGFARSITLVALIGGTSAAVGGQAFAVANELPTNIYNLIAGGIIGAVLVPEIVQGSRDKEANGESLSRLLSLTLLASLILTVLLVALAPMLVRLFAFSWSDSFTVIGQILNAHHVYGPYAWAPVLSNLIGLAGLGAFYLMFPGPNSQPSDWDWKMVAVLCGSATLGTALQAVLMVRALREIEFRFRFKLGFAGLRGPGTIVGRAGLRGPGTIVGQSFGGVLAGQLAYVVVSNVANAVGSSLHSSGTDAASLNSLSNAYLLLLVPHGVVAVSIATGLFTQMSHDAFDGNFQAVYQRTVHACNQISLVSLAVTSIFFACGPLIADVLWGTPVVGQVLACLTLGLSAFSQLYAINRTALALGDGRSILTTQTAVAATTAAGAFACFLLPDIHVVEGIALATSIANIAGWVLAVVLLRRQLRNRGLTLDSMWKLAGTQMRLLVATGAGILTALLAFAWWPVHLHDWLSKVVELSVVSTLVVAVFAGLAWLVGGRKLLKS